VEVAHVAMTRIDCYAHVLPPADRAFIGDQSQALELAR
jgi:hypothetical protein